MGLYEREEDEEEKRSEYMEEKWRMEGGVDRHVALVTMSSTF